MFAMGAILHFDSLLHLGAAYVPWKGPEPVELNVRSEMCAEGVK